MNSSLPAAVNDMPRTRALFAVILYLLNVLCCVYSVYMASAYAMAT